MIYGLMRIENERGLLMATFDNLEAAQQARTTMTDDAEYIIYSTSDEKFAAMQARWGRERPKCEHEFESVVGRLHGRRVSARCVHCDVWVAGEAD